MSLFSQPDDIAISPVVEPLFEPSDLSHAAIEQAITSVGDPEIEMTVQQVLEMLNELCSQRVVASNTSAQRITEQIDPILKSDIRQTNIFLVLLFALPCMHFVCIYI